MTENKILGPAQIIRMSSGEAGKQCDLYPHGSYHSVRKGSDGLSWVEGRIDIIPTGYPFQVVENIPEDCRGCSNCKNLFNPDHPFVKGLCIRCYERFNFVNREEYRAAIRQEMRLEEMAKIKNLSPDLL